MQLLVILLRLEAERIEIGVQMAAHAIGADHHQRAHAVARRALRSASSLGALVGCSRRRLARSLLADRLFRRRPIAVERVDQVALGRRRPVRPASTRRPAPSFRRWRDRRRARRRTRASPASTEVGILLVLGLQRLDIGAVGAVEERGLQQRLIDVLPQSSIRAPPRSFAVQHVDQRLAEPRRRRRDADARRSPSPRSCLRRRPCRRR